MKNSPSYIKHAPRAHSQGSRKQLSPFIRLFLPRHPSRSWRVRVTLLTKFHNCVGPTAAVFWNSSAEALAHLRGPAYWDWVLTIGRADEGRYSTMETLTEWKEPLCAFQGTTAAHSHSVALKLVKTERLCVCVAVERSVDLWLREYFQPLCWMMNYQHTRKDFSCMSVTFRRTVASSPCLDSSLFLRS